MKEIKNRLYTNKKGKAFVHVLNKDQDYFALYNFSAKFWGYVGLCDSFEIAKVWLTK